MSSQVKPKQQARWALLVSTGLASLAAWAMPALAQSHPHVHQPEPKSAPASAHTQAPITPAAGTMAAPTPPANKPVPAAASSWKSPLQHYKRFDASVGDKATTPSAWREANDQVQRLGGWRAYAKEQQASEPTKP